MKTEFDLGLFCGYGILMDSNQPSCRWTENVFVGIKNGKITAVESIPTKKWSSAKRKCKKTIIAPNQVIIPGFVNGHTHLAMTLFRGLSDDLNLHDWLFKKIFPLEAAFVSPEFVKLGTELAAYESLRFGTTCVNDMYFFPSVTANVLKKAGLRGQVSQVFVSGKTPEDNFLKNSYSDRFKDLHKKFKNDSLIRIGLAPHAPYTCDDDVLKTVVQLSKDYNSQIHIHVNEAAHEVPESLKKYNKTPIQRLNDLGVLNDRCVMAHGVYFEEQDISIIQKTRASIIHNPDSNCKLASGLAPMTKYLAAQLKLGLGTDGAASCNDLSMFGVMDLSAKLQKIKTMKCDSFSAENALWLATRGGAQSLNLDHMIGSIEVGKCADLAMIDLEHAHMLPHYNPVSDLVYSCQGLEVDTVVINGKVLVKDKKVLSLSLKNLKPKIEKIKKKIQSFQPEF